MDLTLYSSHQEQAEKEGQVRFDNPLTDIVHDDSDKHIIGESLPVPQVITTFDSPTVGASGVPAREDHDHGPYVHNHDGTYSPSAHNHNGYHALLSHSHTQPDLPNPLGKARVLLEDGNSGAPSLHWSDGDGIGKWGMYRVGNTLVLRSATGTLCNFSSTISASIIAANYGIGPDLSQFGANLKSLPIVGVSQLQLSKGSVSSLAVNFQNSGDSDTGFYCPGNGNIELIGNGNRLIYVGNAASTLDGLWIPGVYSTTTTGSANIRVGSSAGDIKRVTSSGKYKDVQRRLSDHPDEVDAILQAIYKSAVVYTSLCEGDDPDHEEIGGIAEDLEKTAAESLLSRGDGETIGIEYDRIPVVNTVKLWDLEQRVQALERREKSMVR